MATTIPRSACACSAPASPNSVAIEVDAEVPLQPRFAAPKRLTRTYAAGNEDAQGPGAKEAPRETMLTVNWMFDEPAAIETALAFDILEHILIGNPAAPLYKALIDSGLGEALAGTVSTTGCASRCSRSG